MNDRAPNSLWTGSQTEWTRNPRPNSENARLLPSKTFQAIAPMRTTEPTPASPVRVVSVLSPMRSPKRRPAGNSVGTAVKELRRVKGVDTPVSGVHHSDTRTQPLGTPEGRDRGSFSPRTSLFRRQDPGTSIGSELERRFR